RHLAPASSQGQALLDRQRMALARAAADERRADPAGVQVPGLFLDDGQRQLAVGVERGVGRRDEAVDLRLHGYVTPGTCGHFFFAFSPNNGMRPSTPTPQPSTPNGMAPTSGLPLSASRRGSGHFTGI